MKLYLSSIGIPDLGALSELVGKPIAETRLALIPNAQDHYARRARAEIISAGVEYFRNLGFGAVDVVDLRRYHTKPQQLKKRLGQSDVVWVYGGNTFVLRDEIERSGFDKAIRELLTKNMVYGGESAGAAVAGNSLRGVELADNPRFTETVRWNGMGLVDHFFLPHVGNEKLGLTIERIRLLHKADKSLLTLTDTQAFILDGTVERVV